VLDASATARLRRESPAARRSSESRRSQELEYAELARS